jgi:hypothetical protein
VWSELNSVSCTSATACTAVGDYDPLAFPGGSSQTLGERWDGTSWSLQATPNRPVDSVGRSYLNAVSCASSALCTAVGGEQNTGGALVEQWTARPTPTFSVSHIRTSVDGTITIQMKVPAPGRIDVLETAWRNNLAHAAALLEPAPRRFVFARARTRAVSQGTVRVSVTPNQRGRLLVAHHRYVVTLRLWVSYTTAQGTYSSIGFYGIHLPAAVR